jgi:hypothetical protein
MFLFIVHDSLPCLKTQGVAGIGGIVCEPQSLKKSAQLQSTLHEQRHFPASLGDSPRVEQPTVTLARRDWLFALPSGGPVAV